MKLSAPATAEEPQHEAAIPSTVDVASDKSVETHGQPQACEEVYSSKMEEAPFQRNVKRKRRSVNFARTKEHKVEASQA